MGLRALGLPGRILARITMLRHENTEQLQQAARDFDAQFTKLSSLLNGSDNDLEADKMVADQVLGSIAESCRQIKEHLDGIEAGQMGPLSSRHLLASLKRMCGLERGAPITPTTSVNGTPRSHHTFGTPSSINRPTKKERLNSTPVRAVDFDAFPSTPTLDQLGLSGHAMAVVGDQTMLRLDSENTDMESNEIDRLGRRSFISSSSVGMSSPRSTINLNSDVKSSTGWNTAHLSTPPSMQDRPGMSLNQQHVSSPFPYNSPLVHSTTAMDSDGL